MSYSSLVDDTFFNVEYANNMIVSWKDAKSRKVNEAHSIPLLAGYKIINLSNNSLVGKKKFPFSIELQNLDLSHNKLTSLEIVSLPIGALTNLQELDISSNQIETQNPKKNPLTALTHLKSRTLLNLAYNKISNIQPICDNLNCLRALLLTGNELLFAGEQKNETVRALQDLHGLEILLISDCGLKGELVSFFNNPGEEYMEELRILDVRTNDGITFPKDKNNLKQKVPKLKKLYTDAGVITFK